MLVLITISKQSTAGFIMEKSKIMFSFLKEFERRELRRTHNKTGSCVTGISDPSHTSALLQPEPSHSEVCGQTHLLGSSWCSSASVCLQFPIPLCHAAMETWAGWAGKGQRGTGAGMSAWMPSHPPCEPHCLSLCRKDAVSFSVLWKIFQ